MADKINELKTLIETLDVNSPLRKSLEQALQNELKRLGDATAQVSEEAPDAENNSGNSGISELQGLFENAVAGIGKILSPEGGTLSSAQEDSDIEDEAEEEADEDDAEEDDSEEDTEDAEDDDSDTSSDSGDSITSKIDELLNDDEFIAASAGFLLGAVTIGAGALAISALKK